MKIFSRMLNGIKACFLASEAPATLLEPSETTDFVVCSLVGAGVEDVELSVLLFEAVATVLALLPRRATVEYVCSPRATTSLKDVSHVRIGGGGTGGGSC